MPSTLDIQFFLFLFSLQMFLLLCGEICDCILFLKRHISAVFGASGPSTGDHDIDIRVHLEDQLRQDLHAQPLGREQQISEMIREGEGEWNWMEVVEDVLSEWEVELLIGGDGERHRVDEVIEEAGVLNRSLRVRHGGRGRSRERGAEWRGGVGGHEEDEGGL